MLFFAAVAAALVAVSSAQAVSSTRPTFVPMENPGAKKCIVKGTLTKPSKGAHWYALKLDSCTSKNVANLQFVGKNKEIRTSDKFCLDTKTDSNKTGTELVLRKCPSKLSKGMKWTKVGRNQWQNEHKQCMDYDTKAKKFVQKKCATLPTSDKKSTQQFVQKFPASVSCATWGKKWICGKNWVLDTKKDLTCHGATDAKCANVCCKPAQTCQAAGFSKKCPAGFKFVNHYCGNPGQPACSTKEGVCCDREIIKCNKWNKCSSKFQLKSAASKIDCTLGTPVNGPGYAPRCSDSICCDPKPTPVTCSKFSCPSGYEHRSDANRRQCFANSRREAEEEEYGVDAAHHQGGSSAPKCSRDYCCVPKKPVVTPKPITCAQWSGKCDAKKGDALHFNAEKVLCHTNAANVVPGVNYAPLCSSEVCCARDTCENWLQAKHDKFLGPFDTVIAENMKGEEFCKKSDPYSMPIEKKDERYSEPCKESDDVSVCKHALCCIAKVNPIDT